MSFSGEIKAKRKMTTKERYDDMWNKVFYFCLFASMVFIFYLIKDSKKHHDRTAELDPDYPYPQITDFAYCIPIIIIYSLFKYYVEPMLQPIAVAIMKKEYKEGKDEVNQELFRIYKKKLAIHILKLTTYILFSIAGHLILRKMDYFPKSLLGYGDLKNLYIRGYPQSFYLEKPPYFNLYYYASFSYFATDLIWLLFVNDRQTDFINMLLHHVTTLSLILFSYYTNHTPVGAVVLHIHMITDVLVHATRLSLRTDWPEFVKDFLGISLVFFFLYVRQFVFGQVIYSIWKYLDFEWTSVEWTLTLFLCILFLMHMNWNFMLLQKFFVLLLGTKITDTFTFDKAKEAQEKLNKEKQRIKNE